MNTDAPMRRPAERAPRAGAVLAVMCCGMFLVLLDVTVVNVALPSIGADLDAGVSGMQWVVDGYAVSIGCLLLAGGTIGDRYGHRGVVLVGLAGFGAGSVLCAAAPTPGVLVAARVVQGVGAALMLPGSLAVVVDSYPDRVGQARALGIWAAVSSLGLPAGPLLGGVLVSTLGWRWVFVVNAPVVVTMLVLIPRLVVRSTARRDAPLDLPGTLASVLTVGALVYAIVELGHRGLGVIPLLGLVIAALAVIALAVAERRSEAPMLPPALLRRPAFVAANAAALTMNLVTNGILFVTTLYLQQANGLPAWLAGVLLLPMALPLTVLSPLIARLTARFGPRLPMAVGACVAGTGSVCLLAVSTTWSYGRLLPALLGVGVGIAFFTSAVVGAAIMAVSADRSGLASGVNNMSRQIGTALGVAVFGAVAGTPHDVTRFVLGLHRVAVVGGALWLVALVLTLTFVRPARTA